MPCVIKQMQRLFEGSKKKYCEEKLSNFSFLLLCYKRSKL